MDDHSGSVDDRLDPLLVEPVNCRSDPCEDFGERRDLARVSEVAQCFSNHGRQGRARDMGEFDLQRQDDLFDRGQLTQVASHPGRVIRKARACALTTESVLRVRAGALLYSLGIYGLLRAACAEYRRRMLRINLKRLTHPYLESASPA